jgi:MoxR-like ATPase
MLIDARGRLAANPTEAVVAGAGQIILGKTRQIRLAMACILAKGHLLIEDVPGSARPPSPTRSPAARPRLPAHPVHLRPAAGRRHRGVHLRSRDLVLPLPPGPIFAQIILADEINRASPKAQSALLERWRSTR